METYSRERTPYQFSLPCTTSNLFFHTQVQEDAFFGHLVNKTVFKHQTIDFVYMAQQPVMTEVVGKFEAIGLRRFLEHKCNWNDTIIHQFYATVEIDFFEDTIEWMTGKRKYISTFAEFAAVNHLDYAFLTDNYSINMVDENILEIEDIT